MQRLAGMTMETLFKALADRNRLRIVAALLQADELCACQIIELIGVSGATASRHLGILQHAGLVESRKDGRWVHFSLRRDESSARSLVDWIGKRFEKAPETVGDIENLRRILLQQPEDICRSQRGKTCCPEK